MFRWIAIYGTTGGLVAGLILWFVGVPHEVNPKVVDARPPTQLAFAGEMKYGNPLPADKKALPAQAAITALKGHYITVDKCNLTPVYTQEVPSQHDGKLLFVAVEIDPKNADANKDLAVKVPFLARPLKLDDKLLPGEKLFKRVEGKGEERMYRRVQEGEELEPNKIWVDEETRWFRELQVGHKVKKGQLLALVDPSLAYDDMVSKVTKLNAKEADRTASEKTMKEAASRLDTLEKLNNRGAGIVSREEINGAWLTVQKFFYEEVVKRGEMRVAERELAQSLTQVRMHEIRSEVDGVVRVIYRKKGEAVKNLDQVLQVHNLEDLQLEGIVGVENLDFIKEGMPVIVEPSVQKRASETFVGHLHEVNAVAVNNDKDNPLIVSASEDGMVLVWDLNKREQKAKFVHPTAVKAVACTPPGCEANLCLTGSADGTVRLWDLNQAADQSPRQLAKEHRGPINCVAFSLDGRYFATGGEDRTIRIWDTREARLLYTIEGTHKGPITSVHFTQHQNGDKAEARLVSAARDNQLLVWALGTDGARLEPTHFDRRGGDVTNLDVSPDGQHVLFDLGRELRLLSLEGGRTDSVLQNPVGSANFTRMALFSPDGRMVLSANGSEGNLQLWRLATDKSRGYELRQLIWTSSASTCGAFSPYASDKSFAVTGTREGKVVVWALPTSDEITRQVKAEITLAEPVIDNGSRMVRIRARVTDKAGQKLISGNTATLTVYPQ